MFKKVSYLVFALALLAGTLGFVGCDSSGGERGIVFDAPIPADLKQMWAANGEEYTITGTNFTSGYNGSVSYAGTIVNHRKEGSDAGYITIKVTENSFYGADAVGKFYVIHYKNFTSSALSISGAYSAVDPDNGGGAGKATQDEAEDTYTVLNGYFGSYSDLAPKGFAVDAPMPEDLKQAWEANGEEYTITGTNFTSGYMGSVSYAGTITNHRKEGSDAGYITIKVTENSFYGADAVGKFYVIHYKNLTSTSLSISGAYSAADPDNGGGAGKATQDEAEDTYTVLNGYFGAYSDLVKKVDTPVPDALKAIWTGTDSYDFEHEFNITAETLRYTGDYYSYSGDIVKVRDNESSGFITFKYTVLGAGLDPELEGKYCVLYWSNLTENGVDIDIATDALAGGGDIGEATQDEAETAYTIENGYFDPDNDTTVSCTK